MTKQTNKFVMAGQAKRDPATHMWTAPVSQELVAGGIGSLAIICPAFERGSI
jgi:hypothetical protein